MKNKITNLVFFLLKILLKNISETLVIVNLKNLDLFSFIKKLENVKILWTKKTLIWVLVLAFKYSYKLILKLFLKVCFIKYCSVVIVLKIIFKTKRLKNLLGKFIFEIFFTQCTT